MLNGGEEWVIDRSTMSIVKTCDAGWNMSPTYRRNERIGWCTVRLANGVLRCFEWHWCWGTCVPVTPPCLEVISLWWSSPTRRWSSSTWTCRKTSWVFQTAGNRAPKVNNMQQLFARPLAPPPIRQDCKVVISRYLMDIYMDMKWHESFMSYPSSMDMEDRLGGWEVLVAERVKVEILLVASKDLHIFQDLDPLDSLQHSWHVWGWNWKKHPRDSKGNVWKGVWKWHPSHFPWDVPGT